MIAKYLTQGCGERKIDIDIVPTDLLCGWRIVCRCYHLRSNDIVVVENDCYDMLGLVRYGLICYSMN